jgi:homoserine O-acetyltransferase/O-succinyltransferase
VMLVAVGNAWAQEEGVYVIPRFTFEAGGVLDNMKVGYVTFGKINASKDNAILVIPGASGNRHSSDTLIGSGKTFDTDKYFVIGVDPIGGGNSSSPKDGLGTAFPTYNIRDAVRAQHEFITKGLGLTGLHAVAGPSLGAFQGIEWGVTYPSFMKGLILWVPAARSDRQIHAIVDAITAVIALDPVYKGGAYTENPVEGIKRAGMVYFPWLSSEEYLNGLVKDEDFDKAKVAFGEGWAKVWDANSMISRYRAARTHDVSVPYGGDMRKALARVTAKVLVMPSMTDRTVPVSLAREMYRGLPNAIWQEIPSIKGHLACCQSPGTAEHAYVSERTKVFLDSLTN